VGLGVPLPKPNLEVPAVQVQEDHQEEMEELKMMAATEMMAKMEVTQSQILLDI
jgi:hypothetical protein